MAPGRLHRGRQVLDIVAHDSTFSPAQWPGGHGWVGRCLHCNAAIRVGAGGETFGAATIEHIVPRGHGGTEAPDNLALACSRCNHLKGSRLDSRRRNDARLAEVNAQLLARRAARWRP